MTTYEWRPGAEIAAVDLSVGLRIWMDTYIQVGRMQKWVTYSDHRVTAIQRYEHGGIFALTVEPWRGGRHEMVEARTILALRKMQKMQPLRGRNHL